MEDVTITEGVITFDVRFDLYSPVTKRIRGILVDLELQNNYHPGYPILMRGIYYSSRMVSSQYGSTFIKSHYGKISKAYSIWICVEPPKCFENTITTYTMKETNVVGNAKRKEEEYDLLTVVMICLGEEDKAEQKSLLRLLDILFKSELSAKDKKRLLAEEYNIFTTDKMEEEMNDMCDMAEGLCRRIERRVMAEGKALGRAEGRALGMEEGRALGRVEGAKEVKLLVINNLMRNLKCSQEEAIQLLGI